MKKRVGLLLIAILILAQIPQFASSGTEDYAWVLKETVLLTRADYIEQKNESYAGIYAYTFEHPADERLIVHGQEYVGRTETSPDPDKLNGEVLTVEVRWSEPPQVIRPQETLSMEMMLTPVENMQSYFSFSGSMSAWFDTESVGRGGGRSGGVTFLKNSNGESIFSTDAKNQYASFDEIVSAQPRSGSKDGDRMALIISGGMYDARTAYIYEWTAVSQSSGTTGGNALGTASSWAVPNLQKSMNAGLATEKMTASDFQGHATREAFCELVVVMYDKLGGVTQASGNPFSDTSNPDVIKAYNAGIIGGMTPDTFGPDASITREQLCVMIVNALDAAGKSYDASIDFQKSYADAGEISSWASDSVRILNGYGIINGSGETLNPKGLVTREMAVIMLYNAYETFK